MSRPKTVFLTGGTGFLGSNLLYHLLEQGFRVISLVRSKSNMDLFVRIKHPISVIDSEFDTNHYIQSGQLRLVAGDITVESPLLGIEPETVKSFIGEVDFYLNAAASIKFNDYHSTWDTNVKGTRLSFDMAEALRVKRFCQISTAYVKGSEEGKFMEWQVSQGPFSNIYERTKAEGEFEVMHRSKEIGLDYSIFRPGVIVGDMNGQAFHFDGYYAYFAAFHDIKKILAKREQRENMIRIPLATRSDRKATLNMVPVDWLAQTIIALIKKEASANKTFHLTSSSPPKVRWLIETSLEVMGITGVRYLDPDEEIDHKDKFFNNLQRRLDAGIQQYEPYTTKDFIFDQTFAELVMNSHWKPSATINRAYLEKILGYAMKKDFRRG